jgi:hypothetical protein
MSYFCWLTSPEPPPFAHAAVKTITVRISPETVALSMPPSLVEKLKVNTPQIKGKEYHKCISHRRFVRSVISFLDFLKNKDALAARLYQRDSQKVEKCKSAQRRYISKFRQRQNGKFSAELGPTDKIRAPTSFKS